MHYGFYLPTRGPTETRDGILAVAREGERLGLQDAVRFSFGEEYDVTARSLLLFLLRPERRRR